MSLYDKAKQTADFIKSKINNIPKTAIVLGSGLGPFAKEIEKEVEFAIKISLISLYLPYPVTQES